MATFEQNMNIPIYDISDVQCLRWAFGFSGDHQQTNRIFNVYQLTDVASLFMYAVDCFSVGNFCWEVTTTTWEFGVVR